MSAIRQYNITTLHQFSKRELKVAPSSDPSAVLFTFTVKKKSMFRKGGMTWSSGSTTVGNTVTSALNSSIELSHGNPERGEQKTSTMKHVTNSNLNSSFEMPLTLANGNTINLKWKPTSQVGSKMKAFSSGGMHFKIVDAANNRVLAKFIHDTESLDIAGTVEIWENVMYEDWDLFALITLCSASNSVLENAMKALHAIA